MPFFRRPSTYRLAEATGNIFIELHLTKSNCQHMWLSMKLYLCCCCCCGFVYASAINSTANFAAYNIMHTVHFKVFRFFIAFLRKNKQKPIYYILHIVFVGRVDSRNPNFAMRMAKSDSHRKFPPHIRIHIKTIRVYIRSPLCFFCNVIAKLCCNSKQIVCICKRKSKMEYDDLRALLLSLLMNVCAVVRVCLFPFLLSCPL